ncbi:MAG: SDR family oxidoreductase [Alphaproteobacteria bacterium]|nr:SDR family oxidoreductase [Alphaproteobacteria bacterium]MCB9696409.1 SDR family oxidoreductase [Alphaproteobacteria bacterium]
MKLEDKVVVVTGGGSGIGRELVLQLLSRGAHVAAVDRSPATLAETLGLAGDRADRVARYEVDITDRAAVRALPERVIARFGAVDGLINCAGIIQPFVRVADLDDDAIDRVMAVNFGGTLWMSRAFLPLLRERPVAHLANVSSMGGFLPVPGQTVYGASKAAVKLLTEGLASELEETSVRVTTIFPGAIATNIVTNSGLTTTPGGDAAGKGPAPYPAADAARDILDGIEHDQWHVFVGRDATLMDRLVRLAPRRAARLVYRKMKGLLPPT